ncbi:MAG: hypothetical protein JWM82_2854 [Myxococcales bacterium]|nr:hypothetical protein [Myxococcales bacterium]
MIRLNSRLALAGSGFGLIAAPVILAFVGCASSLTVPDEAVAVDSSHESPDASSTDGPTEAAHCPENDCVDYPEVCSVGTLCRADAAFDLRAKLLGIWATGPDDVWTAGTLGTVVHYDGTAWHSVPTGRKETLHSLWGKGPGDVWLGGTNDFVLHSQASTLVNGVWDVYDSWDGTNQACPMSGLWGSATQGVWGILQCLNYSSPFPTPTNTVLHSSTWQVDGGPNWELEYQSPTIARTTWDVHSVFGFGEQDIWVGGSGGVLFRRTLNGEWVEVNSRASGTINSIGGSGPDDIWLVGDLGLIRHWNGTSMDSMDLPADIPKMGLEGVWASSPNDAWIVGEAALLIHYDGKRFTRVPVGGLHKPLPTFSKVWTSKTTQQIWVVGDGIIAGGKTNVLQ